MRALHRLHRDTVDAVQWALSELEALLLAQGLRNGDGDCALEQGWLLRELHERLGLTAGELARRFDQSPSWVSRRLGLVRELPDAVQELVRSGARRHGPVLSYGDLSSRCGCGPRQPTVQRGAGNAALAPLGSRTSRGRMTARDRSATSRLRLART